MLRILSVWKDVFCLDQWKLNMHFRWFYVLKIRPGLLWQVWMGSEKFELFRFWFRSLRLVHNLLLVQKFQLISDGFCFIEKFFWGLFCWCSKFCFYPYGKVRLSWFWPWWVYFWKIFFFTHKNLIFLTIKPYTYFAVENKRYFRCSLCRSILQEKILLAKSTWAFLVKNVIQDVFVDSPVHWLFPSPQNTPLYLS